MKILKLLVTSIIILGNACIAWGQLPDLKIDIDRLESSLEIDKNYDVVQCEVNEGCANSTGEIKALRFDTRTLNIGNADLALGNPNNNPLFVFDSCPTHNHHHFESFATYQLYDLNCNLVVDGHKSGFCLLDSEPVSGNSPACNTYTCGNQGIGADCADVYTKSLDCQILDIDGLADGRYIFFVELNFEQIIQESDYSNNTAYLLIEIDGNKVDVLKSGHDFIFSIQDNISSFPLLCDFLNTSAPLVLKANNQVTSDCDQSSALGLIHYKAGKRIVLTNGFRSGPSFRAEIVHCSHHDDDGPKKTGTTINEQPPPDQSTETQSPSSEEVNEEVNEDITIHPNPSTGRFQLTMAGGGSVSRTQVFIYNVLGEIIYQSEITTPQSEIDISNQSKGIYFVKVISGDEVFVDKIVYQ